MSVRQLVAPLRPLTAPARRLTVPRGRLTALTGRQPCDGITEQVAEREVPDETRTARMEESLRK